MKRSKTSLQRDLKERVKELTCLYGIAGAMSEPGIPIESLISTIVNLLPPAFQFPEIASARVVLDGRTFESIGFVEGQWRISETIEAEGRERGRVEVFYSGASMGDGVPQFLHEERHLIEAVARQIVLILQRRRAEEERVRLQDQLRHADRLATLGQLAAGVAHELNEPIGNILGFSQLMEKDGGLGDQARRDVRKIVDSCMHAREIVRKLMLFARQTPPKKATVNLNRIAADGLFFLESRCAKAGIRIVRDLAEDLPEIDADPAQLHQVLVNLVVNAIQAMPDGGTLTLETTADDSSVTISVIDTGVGMTDEVMKKIFIPFFTTKDIDQGTGLGLPVVHGIVTGHGGNIIVKSVPGGGSSFAVRLPLHKGDVGLEESGNAG